MSVPCPDLSIRGRRQLKYNEVTTKGAVSNTIGAAVDQSSQLRNEAKQLAKDIATLPRAESKTLRKRHSKAQRDLRSEKKRYTLHKQFHNKISNHILKLSASTGFIVEPAEYLLVLNSMSRKLFNMPFINLNEAHPNTIRAYDKQFSKWINKTTENKKFNIFNRSFEDIWSMIAGKDASGLGFKIVELAATIPDATWNSTFQHLDNHDDAIAGLEQEIDDFYSNREPSYLLFKPHNKVYKTEGTEDITTVRFEDLDDEEKRRRLKEDYNELIRDLMDGRTRYVVPKLVPDRETDAAAWNEWAKTDDAQAVARYLKWGVEGGEVHRFHTVVGKDGNQYVYMMVDQEEGDVEGEAWHSYLVQRKSKDPETGHWMVDRKYLTGYNIDVLTTSNLSEGFYEASPAATGESGWKPFNYPMRDQHGTPIDGTNLTSYYNFKRMRKQPNADLVGERKLKKGGVTKAKTVWEVVASERTILENVFNEIRKSLRNYDVELNKWKGLATEHFIKKMGRPPESAKALVNEIISNAGIDLDVWESPRTGRLYTGNSFMGEVKRKYDPNMYSMATGWDFIDKAESQLKAEVQSLKQDININRAEIQKMRDERKDGHEPSMDGKEFLEVVESIKRNKAQLKKAQEELSHFVELKDIDKIPNGEDIVRQRIVKRLVHTKHRKPFVDAMRRERTPAAVTKYIQNTYKGMHYNILTLNLLKALTFVDNDEVAEFLINRVKIATGSLDYNANFLGFDVSNRRIAESMQRVADFFGRDRKYKPEDIHYGGTALNMFASSNLLGMWSALNNNVQRMALVEEFGWKLFTKSWKAMQKKDFVGSDLERAVSNTGVLDLLNHFSDMLTGQERNQSPEWKRHKIDPNVALLDLKLAKREFMQKNNTAFDWLLKDVAGLTGEQQEKVIALKKYSKEKRDLVLQKKRGELWDAMHARDLRTAKRRMKILNRDLTQEEINKLASWKLRWWPTGNDNPLFTFSGGEKHMRTQAAIIGFYVAEESNLLDADSDIYKYEQQEAINAARMSVYNTMFGMSIQWLPEAFGGIGKQLLQYKPYTYHEMVREWRIMQNFMAGNETKIHGFRRLASSFMSGVKGGNKYGDKSVDEFSNRAMRFFLGRALITAGVQAAMWSPLIGTIGTLINTAARASGKQVPLAYGAVRKGYESPWVSIMMKIILTGAYFTGMMGRPPEKKKLDSWWDEITYLFIPPILSWLLSFRKGLDASKPYIPLYNEVAKPIYEGYRYLED